MISRHVLLHVAIINGICSGVRQVIKRIEAFDLSGVGQVRYCRYARIESVLALLTQLDDS